MDHSQSTTKFSDKGAGKGHNEMIRGGKGVDNGDNYNNSGCAPDA